MGKTAGERQDELCCLMDGELGHSEARFLLRRMGHDQALRARWERYHLARTVVREAGGVRAPDNFAQRVNQALADEAAPAAAKAVGGGALRQLARPLMGAAVAAGVALLAYNAWLPPVPGQVGTPIQTLVGQPQPANDLESGVHSPVASSVAQLAAGGQPARNAVRPTAGTLQAQDQAIARYLIRHTQVSAPGQRIPLIYVVTEANTDQGQSTEEPGEEIQAVQE